MLQTVENYINLEENKSYCELIFLQSNMLKCDLSVSMKVNSNVNENVEFLHVNAVVIRYFVHAFPSSPPFAFNCKFYTKSKRN